MVNGLKSKRLKLYNILTSITPEVHYQPPSNVKLNYPCIVYSLSDKDDTHANNIKYLSHYNFTATLMVREMDDPLIDEFMEAATSFNNTIPMDGIYNVYCEFKLY